MSYPMGYDILGSYPNLSRQPNIAKEWYIFNGLSILLFVQWRFKGVSF